MRINIDRVSTDHFIRVLFPQSSNRRINSQDIEMGTYTHCGQAKRIRLRSAEVE